MAKDKLTPKQQRFVEEYLLDLNAAAAYRRAGYKCRSDNVAKVEGHRLLTNPNIAAAIAARQQARSERTEIKADAVLQELARIAFSDMRRFTSWGPDGVRLLSSDNLSSEDAACVSEVSQTTSESGGSLRFKLHDKVQALQMLGKHLGLWKDGSGGSPTLTVVFDGNFYGNEQRLKSAQAAGAAAPPATSPH